MVAHRFAAAPLLTAFALLGASFALAQGTGRSMDIDLSIRSSGMGGASSAVFWGDGTNHWSNPALLAAQRGLRYEWGSTRLIPELADDVRLTSHVIKLAGAGAGLAVSGQPAGIGGVRLSYGDSEGTDSSGNPTGTFESSEAVDSWGFGVNALEFGANLLALTGAAPVRVDRFGDVSFGMNLKSIEMVLGSGPGATGSGDARDLGTLVRATPFDRLGRGTRLPLRLDLAWAYSRLSENDDAIVTFPSGPLRLSRHVRTGFAARAAWNPPAFDARLVGSSPRTAWLRGFSPLVSVAFATEDAEIDGGPGASGYETEGSGTEVTIANVLTWRDGHYRDLEGDIDGDTSGWCVALPLGPWGGLRYERARFPNARDSGLGDTERSAASAWVDPLAIWKWRRERR